LKAKTLFATVAISTLSLIGFSGVALQTASAGQSRHVAVQPIKPPVDQRILVGVCFPIDVLHTDMGKAVGAYQPHKNMPPAGLWINKQWVPPNNEVALTSFVCVAAPVPPIGVPTPPIGVPTPPIGSGPPEICHNDYNGCRPEICHHDYDGCFPHETTTTAEETTTTEAPTTTVPVPVTRCVTLRRVQICTLPPTTETTVAPTTTTTVAPTTTTTEAPTTTTEAPTTTVPPAPEGPCTGLDDCHVVCNDAAGGIDDCNICIGDGSCDVIECPVGFELDAQGDCDAVVTPPIAPTTTVPVVTTLPVTTTTVEVTPVSVPTTIHHCDEYCKS
jgi:hypothetical protein